MTPERLKRRAIEAIWFGFLVTIIWTVLRVVDLAGSTSPFALTIDILANEAARIGTLESQLATIGQPFATFRIS